MLLLGFISKSLKKSLNSFCHVSLVPPVPLVSPVPPCHVLKMVYSYFVSLIYIKLDVVEIIEREKERIANDPELRHLVGREGEVTS